MIYDDESAIKLFMEAKQVYHDRGMQKWLNGFFLSDHTATMKADVVERSRVIEQKPQMDGQEIEQVLEKARIKNKPVAIQLNSLNQENAYSDDIIGMIRGFDSLGIYIDSTRVIYDEIRNVEIYDWHKWSELNNS